MRNALAALIAIGWMIGMAGVFTPPADRMLATVGFLGILMGGACIYALYARLE